MDCKYSRCGCIGHIDGYDHTYWKYKGLYSVFIGLIMLLVMLQPVIKLIGQFQITATACG